MRAACLFLLIVLTVGLTGLAQTGIITGSVTGNALKEKLAGAFVSCSNNSRLAANTITGNDGVFILKNLAPGEYVLKVEYVGYETWSKQVFVVENKPAVVNVTLVENPQSLKNINVYNRINAEEESSSRNSEKKATNIVNIISAKAMERSPDINAANVLQRMSGITLQKNSGGDESYAIIRGLEPRYNNTLINGVKIASPDEKSRYVSLDIVPSDLLQKIEISKTLLPEMEGDAIGGTVNLIMKDAPDSMLFKVIGSVGYSKIFIDRKYDHFSTADIQQKSVYERYGPSYRAQPADFSLSNLDFKPTQALPTVVAGITYGKRFFGHKLGVLLANNFQNQYYGSNSEFNIVYPDPNNHFRPGITDVSNRTSSTQQLNNGLTLHLDYNFNERNKIIVTNVLLYSYEAQARLSIDTSFTGGSGGRTVPGTGPIVGADRSLTNHEYLENLKIEGRHILSKHLLFDWAAVLSSATKKSPDRAEIDTDKKIDSVHTTNDINGPYTFSSSPLYFDGITRIWQHNEDKDLNLLGNITYKTAFKKSAIELKVGGLYRHKTRYNRENEYILRPLGNSGTGIKQEYLGIYTIRDTVYNPSGTFDYDVNNYHAFEDIIAGFGQAKISFRQLDIFGGARWESTSQGYDVNTFIPTALASVRKAYTDLLPAVMIKYKLNNKTNIRASYFKSISRPGYYELVPYTIKGDNADEKGNPYLNHAVADNFDVRYEFFPRDEEQLFVGGFYKKIVNPIEKALLSLSGGQLEYTPQNFGDAAVWGAELAYTKYFGNVGVTGNYTYTYSKVNSPKVRPDTATATPYIVMQSRPLQGQSDNVVNLSLLYKNDKRKIFAQLAYEYIGTTLAEVYPNLGYDYYQQPQSFLSLSAEKQVKKHFVAFGKFNNLLNTPTYIKINGLTVGRDIFKANFSLGIRYSN